MKPQPNFISALLAAAVFALAGGCTSGPTHLAIEPGEYPAAFSAARRALRDASFTVNRIDAAHGVISSDPKPTAGLATPWDAQQTTLAQELEDLVQHQRRFVRITFEPADHPADADEPADPAAGPLVMRVRAVVERVHRPGWRIETGAIRTSTRAFDPQLAARGMSPSYAVAYAEDPLLAARIVRRVKKLMGDATQRPDPESNNARGNAAPARGGQWATRTAD